MRDDLPTGTVTFLFTDVEGSTKLLHALGADAYAESLAEHRRVIRAACTSESGVEVDTQGDAFFFGFPTAPGALRAASALTEALGAGPIRVRVGLHTGTPLVTNEGYIGDDVHRAARIAAAGHGGQVLVSASTAPLVGVELLDLGEHRFKDLSAPERVFQHGAGAFPALKTLHQTNLPIPQTPFLGRERELGQVRELFARDDVRLLTLTGPGGTGKTRLAAQAAGALAERYPHGVFWVPLAPLRDPALVEETASQVLGAKDGLATHVADKEMLLLFDNFEQVVEAAPELGALLAECPELGLLVTSREPLHLGAEQVYPVPPLAREEGVGLFLARARAVRPDFQADSSISEICHRLDDLPLAIELAAARVNALSPEQILARLEQRLPLLTGGARDAPERQRTLRATIEWSYDLLSPADQELFARLSVFRGGCTLEAAEEVCKADLDTLHSLVDKSLLRFTDERYWMLETIREYAAERLATSRAADGIARRHVEHYAALAQRVYERAGEGTYDVEMIESERDNMRIALDFMLASDARHALDLAGWLGEYWGRRGAMREGRESLEAALTVASDASAAARARALHACGLLALRQGEVDSAQALGDEALALDRPLGDARAIARDLNLLAGVAMYRGDLDGTTRLLTESLQHYAIAGQGGADHVAALGNLVMVASASGDHLRAIELGREAEALVRGRDEYAHANLLNNLGIAFEAIGELDEARRAFDDSITLCRLRHFSDVLAYALASLGHLQLGRDSSSALAHYAESLRLAHEAGNQRLIAYCLEGIAAASVDHDAAPAATLLGAASAIRERTGSVLEPEEQAEVDSTISRVRDALGLDVFTAALAAGRDLVHSQAVELALSMAGEDCHEA